MIMGTATAGSTCKFAMIGFRSLHKPLLSYVNRLTCGCVISEKIVIDLKDP